MTDEASLRHPDENDHPAIAAVVDEWFGGRRAAHLAARSWFRHVGGTSWLAVDPAGRAVGFLIGYPSQDHPAEGVIHLVAVDPNVRRRGIGGALIEAFIDGVAPRGVTEVIALGWPGNPPAAAFLEACGFRADDGPGTVNRYGMPAYPDLDGPGEDRIVFRRSVRG